MNLRNRIVELAKKEGLNLTVLADKIGVSKSSLSISLRGNPRLSTLQSIAEVLEVPLYELFIYYSKKEVIYENKCDNERIILLRITESNSTL